MNGKSDPIARREDLLRPYARDHDRSIAHQADRGRKPQVLGEYLVWMSRLWREEMPDAIHGSGVWRDYVTVSEAAEGMKAGGGSLLGSLAFADPFRRLLENSPFETEHASYDGHDSLDEHYVRPLHAAIARLSHRWPLTARWLASLAACDFDWQALATRRGWTHEEAELYLEKAAHLLWSRFREQPDTDRRSIA